MLGNINLVLAVTVFLVGCILGLILRILYKLESKQNMLVSVILIMHVQIKTLNFANEVITKNKSKYISKINKSNISENKKRKLKKKFNSKTKIRILAIRFYLANFKVILDLNIKGLNEIRQKEKINSEIEIQNKYTEIRDIDKQIFAINILNIVLEKGLNKPSYKIKEA